MNSNLAKLTMAVIAAGVGMQQPAQAQTTVSSAFTTYTINGGACEGLRPTDRAILNNRVGALANVGSTNAIVTCHAPTIEGGHIYRVETGLTYSHWTDSYPFTCTAFTGSWVPLKYGMISENTDDGVHFIMFAGFFTHEIDGINFTTLPDASYPIYGQPVSVQCNLPPKTQLNRFVIYAVQDKPKTFLRTP